jgi:hypothetical protein
MADPMKYRDEAARLRVEALATPDHEVMETILKVAHLYERLADQIEKRRKEADLSR